MRIDCCYCGSRGNEEFVYLGDAGAIRPQPAGPVADVSTTGAEDLSAWHDYVYLRDNPAGPHRELWQHAAGCRAWLVVTRDTVSHAILDVQLARDVALARGGDRE